MVYTLGFNREYFSESSVEDIMAYFKDKPFLQYDCETTGVDCHIDNLVCFQLGDFENQFVISPEYILDFKELLLAKTLIGQNIKFDLKFLYKYDIFPDNVYDTMLAEGVLFCGIKSHEKNLASLASQRLVITLNKEVRNGIGKHEMTKEEIQYSADDVKYLELIKDSQSLELTQKDLHTTLKLENNFVLVLAYIEYSGFYLDAEAWKKKMAEDIVAAEKTLVELNDFILDNNFSQYIDFQGDLFSGVRKIKLSWDSPKQVAEFFRKLGVPINIVEKGVAKESVGAKAIAKYEDKFPIVKTYLRYKEEQKVVGTYGQSFLDQINPVTGRIHTNFWQIQDTGRISSGGKDKINHSEYINFQNIPAEPRTRECFTATPGKVLIDADYSGQETVVLANKSMDANLLKFFDNELSDMHSFTASNMYPELYGMDLDKIKKEHKDKRQKAKSAGFAIAYGGNETTIATNENISMEDAKNIYDKYFEAFPNLKAYFDLEKQKGLNLGYILINDITKRKSYIDNYEKYLELKKELNRTFWDNWKLLKQDKSNNNYSIYKEKISLFFKIKGGIERKSLNYTIQGSSADITKSSAVLMFRWLKKENLLKKVWFVNQVHDENILECPEEISKEVAAKLEECMVLAGKPFCKRVPLKADATITRVWSH